MSVPPAPRDLIATALECDPDSLSDESGLGSHPQWDSMGHMAVMLALEAHYGVAISDATIRAYASFPSIRELYASLAPPGPVADGG
ncbi:hypothetical protein A6A04_04120 [Paramagnetospirillum marisnigri]|uniref:Carrier domain-containing protein n=1 Tax=Paramagnetospirillum marisnigri TaxID=1285242 RepID=A0A178MMJ3_9PROT|nr:acyl carrier protein [Paramagnetospirillum marisnigri]OAN49308.1 hypothetical protein A6A04_04120 [Paramagnetospirillum marisnigri]